MHDLEALSLLSDLADGQWGLVTAGQARAVGVSQSVLEGLVQARVLESIADQVWRVRAGGRHPVPRLYAAWLLLDDMPGWQRSAPACGVISHRSAVRLYGVGPLPSAGLEITIPPSSTQPAGEDLTVHKAVLSGDEFTDVHGMPVTSPGRTVVDLLGSTGWGPAEVGRVASAFLRQGWVSEQELAQALTAQGRHIGATGDGRRVLDALLAASAE